MTTPQLNELDESRTAAPPGARTPAERHTVAGEHLLAAIKELAGNADVRRIAIADDDGQPVIEIPLTPGVDHAMLMPLWVAEGDLMAIAADYTLLVERGPATNGPPAA
jgi:hypothetical protein